MGTTGISAFQLKYLHLILSLRVRMCFSFLFCSAWGELPEVSNGSMQVIMMVLFYGLHSAGKWNSTRNSLPL